jgi:hypothetical protein
MSTVWFILVAAFIFLLYYLFSHYNLTHTKKKILAEYKRCDLGKRIHSIELDPKRTSYVFDVPGFVGILGLDAWYCSLDNIHKRCASLVFIVNTSKYDTLALDRPFFPTKKFTVTC